MRMPLFPPGRLVIKRRRGSRTRDEFCRASAGRGFQARNTRQTMQLFAYSSHPRDQLSMFSPPPRASGNVTSSCFPFAGSHFSRCSGRAINWPVASSRVRPVFSRCARSHDQPHKKENNSGVLGSTLRSRKKHVGAKRATNTPAAERIQLGGFLATFCSFPSLMRNRI